MDMVLIRSMSDSGDGLSGEDLQTALYEHREFLDSGGDGGYFEGLEVAGMPLNVYMGNGSRGTQLVMRMKKFNSGTDLSNQNLAYSELSGMFGEGVNFRGALLDGSHMTYSFFAGADFTGASLVGADLTGCDLRGASFRDADLTDTDFEIANCEGADFTGAILDDTKFPGTNLTDIKR
jgi:uncharacterized protein YjbI with pentapeptide repeats